MVYPNSRCRCACSRMWWMCPIPLKTKHKTRYYDVPCGLAAGGPVDLDLLPRHGPGLGFLLAHHEACGGDPRSRGRRRLRQQWLCGRQAGCEIGSVHRSIWRWRLVGGVCLLWRASTIVEILRALQLDRRRDETFRAWGWLGHTGRSPATYRHRIRRTFQALLAALSVPARGHEFAQGQAHALAVVHGRTATVCACVRHCAGWWLQHTVVVMCIGHGLPSLSAVRCCGGACRSRPGRGVQCHIRVVRTCAWGWVWQVLNTSQYQIINNSVVYFSIILIKVHRLLHICCKPDQITTSTSWSAGHYYIAPPYML